MFLLHKSEYKLMAEKYFYSIIFFDTELNKALQKIIFYLQTRDCAENKVRTKR